MIFKFNVKEKARHVPLIMQHETDMEASDIALLSGKGRGDGTEKEWKEEERRDLASSRLTNCKYLDCGCRMTLINIANGTECRRRNEEVRPSPRAGRREGWNCKETVVGYTGAARGRRRRVL